MGIKSKLFMLMALLFSPGVLSCGDSGNPVVDTGLDTAGRLDTAGTEAGGGVDAGIEAGAEAGTEAGAEAGADTGIDGSPANAVCAKAATLTRTASTGSGKGVIASTDTDDDVSFPAGGCTSTTHGTPGADDIYKVTLIAGVKYFFKVVGDSSYDQAVYLLSDCMKPLTSCVAGADASSFGLAEMFTYTPTSTGTYFIGVDSRHKPGASHSHGSYTVTMGVASPPPLNDMCSGAKAMTWIGTKATTSGDTGAFASDTVNLPAAGCTGKDTEGPDLFYKVAVTAGKTYEVKVAPFGSFDAALYLLSSCASPTSACTSGADSKASGAEKLIFTAAATGDQILVVDSSQPGTSSYGAGTFTLTVEEYVTPANDTCSGATAIPWAGSSASITSDNTMASNTINLPSTGCTGNDTEGGDLFYTVNLTAGKTYGIYLTPHKVFLDPTSGFDAALYLLSSCTSPATACTQGADLASTVSAEFVTITPTTTGSQIIVVDTKNALGSSFSQGSFTVSVKEVTVVPNNDSCTAAEAISLTGGTGKATGDSTHATSTINMTSGSCVGNTTPGPDVFYSFSATTGQTYKITVTPPPNSSSPPISYDPAIYAFTSCAAAETTCVAGADGGLGGAAESIVFTAKNGGTHYIGVDSHSYASAKGGSFTVDVSTFTPPTNDSCAAARVVTLTAGKATVSDYKTGVTSTLATCGATTLAATDLWYRFTPTVGKKYKITFKPQGAGGYFGVWDGNHSCVATAMETACGLLGASHVWGGSAKSLTITSTSGDIYFVADGYSTPVYDLYDFTFDIEELP